MDNSASVSLPDLAVPTSALPVETISPAQAVPLDTLSEPIMPSSSSEATLEAQSPLVLIPNEAAVQKENSSLNPKIYHSPCIPPNSLAEIERTYSSVLDFEGITSERVQEIGSEMVRLTTKWQQKSINTLNKQFQNSVMNYFLECYVSELLVAELGVEFKRDVFKLLTASMEQKEGANLKKRYMTLLNYFLDSLETYHKVSAYVQLLLSIVQESTFSSLIQKDTIDYQTQYRKKMTALLLLEHALHSDRKTKFPDFYCLWSYVFTFCPLKRKKSKNNNQAESKSKYTPKTSAVAEKKLMKQQLQSMQKTSTIIAKNAFAKPMQFNVLGNSSKTANTNVVAATAAVNTNATANSTSPSSEVIFTRPSMGSFTSTSDLCSNTTVLTPAKLQIDFPLVKRFHSSDESHPNMNSMDNVQMNNMNLNMNPSYYMQSIAIQQALLNQQQQQLISEQNKQALLTLNSYPDLLQQQLVMLQSQQSQQQQQQQGLISSKQLAIQQHVQFQMQLQIEQQQQQQRILQQQFLHQLQKQQQQQQLALVQHVHQLQQQSQLQQQQQVFLSNPFAGSASSASPFLNPQAFIPI